ncbi:MAG: putative RNA uridine N3 methyltransferase [Candidatus Caldarchaeum sp.]
MKQLTVFMPHSFTTDVPSMREATLRIGQVGRMLATFRVNELVLYPDKPGNPDVKNARFVKEILDYLVTAPYLRKKLYPIKHSLRYAGLLPPLNIPTHPEADAVKTMATHYRQALVTASGPTSILDAGLGKPLKIKKQLPKNSLVTLKIQVKQNRIKYKLVSRKTSEVYTGFKVRIVNNFAEELKHYSLKVATSRLGKFIHEIYPQLKQMMASAETTCIVFGSTEKGLKQIAEDLGLNYDELFDITVNVVPNQAVKTIRTEEALAYTLALIRFIENIP